MGGLQVIKGQDILIQRLTDVHFLTTKGRFTSFLRTCMYICALCVDTCVTFDIMQIKVLSLKPSST